MFALIGGPGDCLDPALMHDLDVAAAHAAGFEDREDNTDWGADPRRLKPALHHSTRALSGLRRARYWVLAGGGRC
jgi:hypothetical protein